MEVINVLRPIVALALAAVLSTGSEGCKPANQPSPADLYAMEIIGCVEKSKSKEEFRVCRTDVDRKFGLCPIQEWPRIGPCD